MSSGGAGRVAANPIDAGEFDRRMSALGPFESMPEIAVAVSGGADSLCLALLLRRWTAERSGKAVALIIDHGLRPGSHDEACAVKRQLLSLGMAAEVLPWLGSKPQSNIQAVARRVRYRLLVNWCRSHGFIHLALAHHAADQAETHLLRRRAGSGADGLAGMSCISERDGARIIRPLLRIPPERLRATLAAVGLAWIEDPSNRDTKFARTGLRLEIRSTGTVLEHCDEARRYAAIRGVTERRTTGLLASSVKLYPSGHAIMDTDLLADMEPHDGRRCLARVISCIGVRDYPPRTKQLESLRLAIVEHGAGAGRTLGGCAFLRPDPHSVVVTREPAAATEILPLKPGVETMWDGRFKVRTDENEGSEGQFTVRRLEDWAWGVLRRRFPDAAQALSACGGEGLPAPARAALPMLCDLDGPHALPHLPKQSGRSLNGHFSLRISFQPHTSLAGASFAKDGG